MNLSELIRHHRGDRSYDDLSRAMGGKPTAQRLQQIATTPPAEFIKPDTVRLLAKVLRVRELDVVLAVAESLGLDVASEVPQLGQVLAALASDLDEAEVEAVVRLVRTFKQGGEAGATGTPATKAPDPRPADEPADEVARRRVRRVASPVKKSARPDTKPPKN